MAGIDPSALAMQAVLAAQTVIAEATLDLGAIAQSVIAQLKTGDLLSALVLPPSEGVDHISLFGQSLPAQLPPGITPGDTLALQVTGFSPTQIFVRNLGAIDPQNPPETANVELPANNAQLPAQAAPLARGAAANVPAANVSAANVPAAAAQTENLASNAAAQSARSAIAPPVEVFVAASVQPARREMPSASTQEPVLRGGATPAESAAPTARTTSTPSGETQPQSAQSAGEPGVPAPNAQPNVQQSGTDPMAASELEARLATARGARILPRPPEIQQAATESPVRTNAPILARGTPLESPPPPISMRGAPSAAETPLASGAAQPLGEEEQLLARLDVPATPAMIVAARQSANAPQLLATAFARAQSVLARLVAQPAVTTVRSTMAFVSTLDPANAVALPQQLAAYVRTILGSTEGALATLAKNLAALEPTATANAVAQGGAPNAAANPMPSFAEAARIAAAMPHPNEGAVPAAPVVASPANEAAVLSAQSTLNQDVKSALVALAQDPQSASVPGAASALGNAVTAISAAQIHLLAANVNADPRTLIVPLPVFFRDGGSPTQLRIGRDAPGTKKAMDADNFTLGFLLDTKTLGTVAIEVETSGRAVSVKVKTERDGAAKRFREAFGVLRDRFESLRYRIAGMNAAVAARSMPGTAVKKNAEEPAPKQQLDAQA